MSCRVLAAGTIESVRQIFLTAISTDTVEAVIDAIHQRMTFVACDLVGRQSLHLINGGFIHTTEEVVINTVIRAFLLKRRAQEAIRQEFGTTRGEIEIGGYPAILHFLQGNRLRADAVLGRLTVQIRVVTLRRGRCQCAFHLGDK